MVQLQLRAEEYAAAKSCSPPTDLPGTIDSIYKGFERALLVERLAMLCSPEVQQVVAGLQAEGIIRTYAVADLLASYVPGSREWLYKRVTAWLDAVAPMPVAGTAGEAAAAAGQPVLDAQSRMFMLLAGPGMGKSVFSAVVSGAGAERAPLTAFCNTRSVRHDSTSKHTTPAPAVAQVKNKLVVRSTVGQGMVTAQHFFKVGQPRAQAKAMVLCFAHQLAERLPGMAALLVPVVAEHGAGGSLSMLQAFEKWVSPPPTLGA